MCSVLLIMSPSLGQLQNLLPKAPRVVPSVPSPFAIPLRIRKRDTWRNRLYVVVVRSAVLYPNAVRDCIKAAVAAGKSVRPDDFVRVNIDLPKLGLKLAWRAKNSSTWIHHNKIIPFPQVVLDNPSKNFAGKLELTNLPFSSMDQDDSTLLSSSQST